MLTGTRKGDRRCNGEGTLRQMAAQGREVNPDDVAALSAHRRDNVLRFGDYDTATLHIPPGPYGSALRLPADGL
ncbi:hypothetical protein [Streptomyces mutabilis]|uniref:hypothetical protein n=1 Tax=Streptomyces mutabilis TaxID=67332 RepID=UPI003A4C704F